MVDYLIKGRFDKNFSLCLIYESITTLNDSVVQMVYKGRGFCPCIDFTVLENGNRHLFKLYAGAVRVLVRSNNFTTSDVTKYLRMIGEMSKGALNVESLKIHYRLFFRSIIGSKEEVD